MVINLSFIKKIALLNIARINRIRRKPINEIIVYIGKRSRIFLIHIKDLIFLSLTEEKISDKEFVKKIDIENLGITDKNLQTLELNNVKEKIIKKIDSKNLSNFFFKTEDKEKIMTNLKKFYTQSIEETIIDANEIMEHKFNLLGIKVQLDEEINWHSSIDNDEEWSKSYSPNIDYFSSNRISDIKLAWELNRMQHLVTLGKAFWMTEEEKYVEEYKKQILSWIKQNPYKKGINWMEGIETSIRLIAWIWAYFFFRNSHILDTDFKFKHLKSIYLQAKFIDQHYSDKWNLNNNHLIAEAVGLIYVGAIFPFFSESNRWVEKGFNILEQELNKQILLDGVTWEQSTGYHKFVTDLYLHAVILAKINNISIDNIFYSKLEKMCDFLYESMNSQGKMPSIGDSDDASVLKICRRNYFDATPTVSIGYTLANKEVKIEPIPEEVVWLLGPSQLNFLDKGSLNKNDKSQNNATLFYESGYTIFKQGNNKLIFTSGTQNKEYLHCGHKHMDMLSFTLGLDNKYFIIDPGTYTYYGEFDCRKYFKSIKSHNSIIIDKEDPAELKEIFETSNIPFSKIINYNIDEDTSWVTAQHNGYSNVIHSRTIMLIRNEYWLLIDYLEGKGIHECDINFHFHQDTSLNYKNNQDFHIALLGNNGLIIKQNQDLNKNFGIIKGYNSPEYGVLYESKILKFNIKDNLPKIFATILYPLNDIKEVESHIIHIDITKTKETEIYNIHVNINENMDSVEYYNNKISYV